MRDVEVIMAADDEILTSEEASELLKVSNKTVLKLARDGNLPGQKVGRAWRFCRSELVAYVAQRPNATDRVSA
jgi:excisionase family DNA binding protein